MLFPQNSACRSPQVSCDPGEGSQWAQAPTAQPCGQQSLFPSLFPGDGLGHESVIVSWLGLVCRPGC